MIEFSYNFGAIYIFENIKEERIKIGFTSNAHDISSRLNDINDKWSDIQVRCQICGTHIVRFGFITPRHPRIGNECPGSNQLPLELDVSFAESHLQELKKNVQSLSGSEKGSLTRRIKTLENRIELYRDYQPKTGIWKFRVAYISENAKKVESLTHEILVNDLDGKAPIGEIFCCTLLEATEAVKTSLNKLGLLERARKRNGI